MFKAKRVLGDVAMVIAGFAGIVWAVTSSFSVLQVIIVLFGSLCLLGMGVTGLALFVCGTEKPQNEKVMDALVITSAGCTIGLGAAMIVYGVLLVAARGMPTIQMSDGLFFVIGVLLLFGGIFYLLYAITVK